MSGPRPEVLHREVVVSVDEGADRELGGVAGCEYGQERERDVRTINHRRGDVGVDGHGRPPLEAAIGESRADDLVGVFGGGRHRRGEGASDPVDTGFQFEVAEPGFCELYECCLAERGRDVRDVACKTSDECRR